MSTFVVYYRIHLNLNLEASARQWPNNLSHPLWETPALRRHVLVTFLSSGIRIWFVNMSNCLPKSRVIRRGLFQPPLHFWLIRLTLKAHWTFLNIYTHKRLIHSGANGFKPDNVPLSLRDTGYCRGDHKVSLPVYNVTVTNTTVYSISGCNKNGFMFTKRLNSSRWQKWHKVNCTVVFQGEFPLQSKPLPSHPCSLRNIYKRLQYICV